MKMANTRNLNSKNPDGRYVWLRTQIGKILRNEVYIGNVVSGKTEQKSPKIKKKFSKEKSEYIVKENMHEPIISKELWEKVQNKLNSYHTDNRKKYEYPLKDLVYCEECGNKVRFQHNSSKNKSGEIYWKGNTAVCGKRADYKSLCDNVVIGEKILIKAVKDTISEEINKIEYTSKELKEIYNKAQKKIKKARKVTQNEQEIKNKELNKLTDEITRLYERKILKEITVEEFTEIYQKLTEKKKKIQKEIEELNNKENKLENKSKSKNAEDKKIIKLAKEFLKMDNPDNEILKKLVKRIEFDKNKNIKVELTFAKKVQNLEQKSIHNNRKIKDKNVVISRVAEKKWYIAITGNHTVNHKSMPSLTEEQIEKEILELHQAIYEKYNYEMTELRPPMGEFSEKSLAVANNLGYRTVMWSFAYKDWEEEKQPNEKEAIELITKNFHSGEIMLLHANSSTNTNILPEIIKQAREQGYVFESLKNFEE